MSISFGGRAAEAIASPPPAKAAVDDLPHLSRLDSNVLHYWLYQSERMALQGRMTWLAERLDHPELLNHPRWGEAWSRFVRMEGEMAFLLQKIADHKRCVERDYGLLSTEGKRMVRETWAVAGGVEIIDAVTAIIEDGRLLPSLEAPF